MAKDTMTITRKIELIPVYDAKFHKKWFDPFVNRYYNEKIEWKKNCIKKNMKKAEKRKN